MDSHTILSTTTSSSVLDATNTTAISSTDVSGVIEEKENQIIMDKDSISVGKEGEKEKDEEEEGGFVSGEEDFDTATELTGVVEDVEDEDMDAAFVEPPETLIPIGKLSESEEEEEEVEVNVLGVEGSADVDGVGSEAEKRGLDDLVVVEEGGGDNVKENETSVVKDVGEGLVEVDGVKFTEEGDAVVETIKVDVNVAQPGVAVVEDVKPVIEASLGTEKPEFELVATEDVDKDSETPVLNEVVSERGIDNLEEVDSATVKSVGENLIEVDEVKFTAHGNTVVESINGNVIASEPGVAVVEDVKPVIETSSHSDTHKEASVAAKGEEMSDKEVELLQEDVSVENAKEQQPITSKLSNGNLAVVEGAATIIDGDAVKGSLQNQLDRSLTDEDSVSTDKQIEKEVQLVGYEGTSMKEAANEVLVNGNLVEVEGDAKPNVDGLIVDDAKLTNGADSMVENVHLNVLEPGVVGVEDLNEKPEAKAAESGAIDALGLSNGLDQTTDVADEIQEAFCQTVDVPNEKLETGGNQNEVDQLARAYDASPIEDLDQEDGDDEIKRFLEEARELEAHEIEVSASDEETDGMIFGSSEAAKQFLEELEQRSAGDSYSGAEISRDPSQMVDGQIVSDSDEEVDTDEEENGKELFDSAALAAILKAATGGGSDGNVTLSAQDVSNLFSAERPAGLGSSLRARPAPRQIQPNLFSSSGIGARADYESNLSEEERKKLESIQQLRVKFLRLVQRLGQSSEDSIASQVLYRLVLVAGRPSSQAFSIDAAKRTAEELESKGVDNLNFSLNILVIGKSGVGKSATINSIFGQNMAGIDAFEPATTSVKEISGMVDGVYIRVFDTPGLKTSVMDQGYNRKILASVKKFTKKCQPDIVLYVDRLDSQTRDLNDLPMLKTITSCLGAAIWRSVIVTLTHSASAPPDGPSGTPLSYEVFVAQRTHAVQQSIGQAASDLRLMNPSQMNPVSLAENHPSCRKNRDGLKILPNGQTWRPQLLMFCYSMKILSEASALFKQQDPFDHQKLFGFRVRAPPLPYLLSWLLQSRTHPKLSADQGGDNDDSDIDLDDLSESDGEEEKEDEYDQLPSFKPLRKFQLAKLNKEQLKAYYEEYDYRVKLLQKKQWKEEWKRMKEMKKGKVPESEYLGDDADPDNGAPAAVPVPLPDMVLPPSFDGDNPAYRYRFLEPSSQFLARPVLDNHGWDHDCGYDGVNLEQNLAIASRFPAAITVQLTKDKKEFNVHLDSSVAAKHGENASTMAGFDIQNIGKKLAYIVRGETKFKNFKKNKTTAGFSVTFLGENVATGVKIEDQIPIGKRLVLVGSTGTVRSQNDAAYGANLEVKLREADFPIGQDQSTLGLSLVKWRGDLALGANLQSQISVGRGSKVAVRLGLNNKSSGQITVRTSTSDQLQIALIGIYPLIIGIYRAIMTRVNDDYGAY